MKKIIVITTLLVSLGATAQSSRYEGAMKKNLALFDSVKTVAEYQTLSAAFERIGDAEKTQWLPYYYAGLALSLAGWTEEKLDKDANAERIKGFCDKADAIQKTSEIYELRNMAATQQMMVDPQARWATSGQEATNAITKGLELNPSNPRLHYLQAMGIFNTPEQFGGGKMKAKPQLEKAIELFKSEPKKALHPQWGLQQAEEALAQCK